MEANTLLFDLSLQKLNVLFKYSGMNLQNVIKTTSDVFKYRWLFFVNLLWNLSVTAASIYYYYVGFKKGEDLIELTRLTPCITYIILAMIKAFCHTIHEADVFKLIENMRQLERQENDREKSPEKEKIVAENRQFLNRVVNCSYALSVSMLILDFTPILWMALKYKSDEFKLLLPYLDVFAYLPKEFKYWPFAYFQQIYVETIILLELNASDNLFYTYCTYIMIQFKLLAHDIERVILDNGKVMSDVDFHKKFRELVKWHQDILESSEILENIYSKANMFNFLASSLVICLTGFNVTVFDDLAIVSTCVIFLFVGLVQVFFLCFFADLLMSASMDVSIAVYDSRWYSTSPNAGKGLLLMLTRSQKPCKLTASGFSDVNLNAFMRVLSTSWSYFALLQTIYGQE